MSCDDSGDELCASARLRVRLHVQLPVQGDGGLSRGRLLGLGRRAARRGLAVDDAVHLRDHGREQPLLTLDAREAALGHRELRACDLELARAFLEEFRHARAIIAKLARVREGRETD